MLNMAAQVSGLPEASAIGAALLAGLGAGTFRTSAEAVASLCSVNRVVQPVPEHLGWYNRLYKEMYRTLYPALKEIHHRLDGFG